MRTAAVIYAAGAGLLAPLAGRPLVTHSLAAFAPKVDEVVLVAAPDVAAREYHPAPRIAAAAGTRAQAVHRALAALGDGGCRVLIHDAVWPLVSPRVIRDCLTALESCPAVCAAVPAPDTMVAVRNDVITERPPRDRLRRRQYPQGFSLPVIRRGYRRALADPGFRGADECGIVLRYLPDVPVRLVPGSEQGFPVTSPLGLGVAETLLRAGLP